MREEYPDVAEGSDRFYALTMAIFKKMSGMEKAIVPQKVQHAIATAAQSHALAKGLSAADVACRLIRALN